MTDAKTMPTAAEVAAAHRADYDALMERAKSLGHGVPLRECADIVRQKLTAQFPGQSFSVRIDRMGGSSVSVAWSGGPSEDEVEVVTRPLHGWVYDGSIDMAEPRPTILLLPGGDTDFVQYSTRIVWLRRGDE
jgi:hypothetical protein